MSTDQAEIREGRVSRRMFLQMSSAGLIAGLLAACVAPVPPQAPASPGSEIVTIEFANDWNAGKRFQIITDARNIFEANNPNVHVKMLHLGGGTTFAGGFADYIVPRFLTGEAPDLIYGPATFIYSHEDYLLDMTDMLESKGWDPESTYDVYRSTHNEAGRQYGIPFNIFMSGWLYNKTLFEENGVDLPTDDWTWDDLLEMARALTKPDEGQYGVHAFNSWEYGYFPLMYANGARFVNNDFTQTAFNTEEAAAALQWYIDLIYKEEVAPTPEMASSILAAQTGDIFSTGKIGIAPRGLGLDSFNASIGSRFEYSLVLPPKSPTTGNRGVYKGMEPILTAKETTTRGTADAALDFALFLISEEFQSHISLPENRVTAVINKRVTKGEVGNYLDAPPLGMEVVAQQFESDYIYDHPMFEKYGEFRQALWTPVDRAFLNEITAAEALQQAQVDCDAILASVA
jgi:multiple sugar transport system substrate-binding protein